MDALELIPTTKETTKTKHQRNFPFQPSPTQAENHDRTPPRPYQTPTQDTQEPNIPSKHQKTKRSFSSSRAAGAPPAPSHPTTTCSSTPAASALTPSTSPASGAGSRDINITTTAANMPIQQQLKEKQ